MLILPAGGEAEFGPAWTQREQPFWQLLFNEKPSHPHVRSSELTDHTQILYVPGETNFPTTSHSTKLIPLKLGENKRFIREPCREGSAEHQPQPRLQNSFQKRFFWEKETGITPERLHEHSTAVELPPVNSLIPQRMGNNHHRALQ